MIGPDVTVVIPTLNAEVTIAAQIEALSRQVDAPSFEVILVDNGCTDDSVEVARATAGDSLNLRVVKEARRGVNYARNAGIAASTTECILLCDADDRVGEGWVRALAAAVDEAHWAAGVVDYEVLNDQRTLDIWSAPSIGVPRIADPYVDGTFGGSCAFRRHMWETLGGFDHRLSGPTDENEFFMRAFAAGFRPRVVEDAPVGYRLRPGLRSWLKMRFRSGVGQGVASGCDGGRHLLPLCRPPTSLAHLAKVVFALPKYMRTPALRQQWCGGVLRQLGRIVGWWSAAGRAIRRSSPA